MKELQNVLGYGFLVASLIGLILGILAIAIGAIPWIKGRVVRGAMARAIGWLLVLQVPLAFVVACGLGTAYVNLRRDEPYEGPLGEGITLGFCLTIGIGWLAALVLCSMKATAKEPPSAPIQRPEAPPETTPED
jgi:hypothetical protein